MGTNFDDILNQAGEGFIRFLGKTVNDVFTPTSFSISDMDGQISNNTESSDLNSLALFGASGIGLAATAGIITVASHIQTQLNSINNRINYAVGKLESIDKKIDQLLTVTKRIDLKVAESHLREAIKHHLRFSITEAGVDLVQLAKVEDDLNGLLDSLDEGIYGNSSIRLSSDVRALLESICMVFTSARMASSTVYNYHNAVKEISLIQVGNLDFYFYEKTLSDVAGAVLRTHNIWWGIEGLKNSAQELIKNRFSFCDDDDFESMNAVFTEYIQQNHELFGSPIEREIWNNLPDSVFSGSNPASDVESYLEAWLWKTDAGLLARLRMELIVYKLGYESLLNTKIPSTDPQDLVICAPFNMAKITAHL